MEEMSCEKINTTNEAGTDVSEWEGRTGRVCTAGVPLVTQCWL